MQWFRSIGKAFIPSQRNLDMNSLKFTALTPTAVTASFDRCDDSLQALQQHAEGLLSVEDVRRKKGFIIDMDGVLYHGSKLLDGASDFVQFLHDQKKRFVFLTNSSERTPLELDQKLKRLGVNIGKEHFYTSALATAAFVKSRKPQGGSAFVIGEAGLISALYDEGFTLNDNDPDFVIVGETRNYNYEKIEHAIHLVLRGARLIGTNLDYADKMHDSFVPAGGALIKPIEMVTNRKAYFVGKPNPIMMKTALRRLGLRRSECVIVGDRMDTDILGGLQAEIHTVLVLSGVTDLHQVPNFAYRPDVILPRVGSIVN
jgi:NagD protein